MTELTYENENGLTVYTSRYLKNRGSCCKTSCLHCPYGCTLKTHGLKFEEIKETDLDKAREILSGKNDNNDIDISASLLGNAFGAPKKVDKISKENIHEYQFVLIKDVICGLVKKGKLQASKIYLTKHFKDQEITLDTVNSFI
jgi:hypothetical protein